MFKFFYYKIGYNQILGTGKWTWDFVSSIYFLRNQYLWKWCETFQCLSLEPICLKSQDNCYPIKKLFCSKFYRIVHRFEAAWYFDSLQIIESPGLRYTNSFLQFVLKDELNPLTKYLFCRTLLERFCCALASQLLISFWSQKGHPLQVI